MVMRKTFYILLDGDNVVRDIIEYPHEGYIEIEADWPLPIGATGGWFKWEDGQFVEYPELRPPNPLEDEVEQLKQVVADLTELILFGGEEQ